eukprot:TRINITY_DN10420_c0_g1_i26.p1 TRINITY_DN10420_c0_g1~~TRINITY_DN10420_c0_g1_i26.p1  ORF type:complete len:231 (-),score=1.56 TRINITY_DN10420_c0_g1_i26:24-716(-)
MSDPEPPSTPPRSASPTPSPTGTPPDTPSQTTSHLAARARVRSKLQRGGTAPSGLLSPTRSTSSASLSQSQSTRRTSRPSQSPGIKRAGTHTAPTSPVQSTTSTPVGSVVAKPGVPLFHNVKEVRHEGWLSKKNSTGITGLRAWQRRYFILFPHSLCYWVSEKASKTKAPRGKWDSNKILRVVYEDAKSALRFDIFTNDERVIELKADTQEIGRAVQQECRDRSRMPSSA